LIILAENAILFFKDVIYDGCAIRLFYLTSQFVTRENPNFLLFVFKYDCLELPVILELLLIPFMLLTKSQENGRNLNRFKCIFQSNNFSAAVSREIGHKI